MTYTESITVQKKYETAFNSTKSWYKSIAIVILLLIISGTMSFVSIFIAKAYGQIIDEGVVKQNTTVIFYYSSVILILTFVSGITRIIISIKINYIGLNFSKSIKANALSKILKSPLEFFDRIDSEELNQRLNEIDLLSSVFTPQMLNTIISIITSSYAFIEISKISFHYFILHLIIFIAVSAISVKLSKKSKDITVNILDNNNKMNVLTRESFAGIKEIKSFNMSNSRFKTIMDLNDKVQKGTSQQNKLFASTNEIIRLLTSICSLSVVILFSKLFLSQDTTIGSYIEISRLSSLIIAPAISISSFIAIIQPLRLVWKRITYFHSFQSSVSNKGIKIERVDSIELENVSFSYNASVPLLTNINLKISPRGSIWGIRGKNGSGKTTLIKLILGLYETYTGSIRINDTDIKNISSESLQDKIALVFQETVLFNGTIYQNISLDFSTNSQNKMQVLKLVNTMNMSSLFPSMDISDVLDMQIIESGKNLSGGQKRMIAIARALYKNPCVLVMDEPTSNLDESAKAIILNLISSLRDYLVILVTHDNDLERIEDNYYKIQDDGSIISS